MPGPVPVLIQNMASRAGKSRLEEILAGTVRVLTTSPSA
jgi:hypothetical protein